MERADVAAGLHSLDVLAVGIPCIVAHHSHGPGWLTAGADIHKDKETDTKRQTQRDRHKETKQEPGQIYKSVSHAFIIADATTLRPQHLNQTWLALPLVHGERGG